MFDGHIARKLTVAENLALQGFSDIPISDFAPSTLLRMIGNAVTRPVGEFVVSSVMESRLPSGVKSGFSLRSSSGYFDGQIEWSIDHRLGLLASNLADFLEDKDHVPLSAQASAGLIVRSVRSATPMPSELFDVLYKHSLHRRGKIHPSRADSLSAFREMLPQIIEYRNSLEERNKRWANG